MIKRGFTLIELLVVISIIGVIMALSIFGLMGAREASRDGKRKADLEQIRSAVEIYRADCNVYPLALGESLIGDDSNPSCAVENEYLSLTPLDPLSPDTNYLYWSDGITYEICASLEQKDPGGVTCGDNASCGSSDCNYKVTNP